MVTLYAVALLFNKNKELLLLRRINAEFGNGMYSIVGGKVENNEPALKAIQREIREEIGLTISTEKFRLVHTFHRKGSEHPLIALCFTADLSSNEIPSNCEPTKHADVRFFPLNSLPINILPAHKQAIECVQKGIYYSEHNW